MYLYRVVSGLCKAEGLRQEIMKQIFDAIFCSWRITGDKKKKPRIPHRTTLPEYDTCIYIESNIAAGIPPNNMFVCTLDTRAKEIHAKEELFEKRWNSRS